MRVGVLGAGVTGAVIARELAKEGHEVVLYEASSEVGGLVASHDIAGTSIECFYHHIFTHESHIRELIDDLGVGDKLEWIPSSVGIFDRDGKIWPFTSPRDLLSFKRVPLFDRVRMGASSLLAPYLTDWRKLDDVPIEDWIRRLMGKRVLDEIWDPMLEVKWGEVRKEVPAAWLWARLSQRQRSRNRKDMGELLGYMRGGFRALYLALQEDLAGRGVKLKLNTQVRRIGVSNGRIDGIETDAGFETYDHVVSTLPIPVFAALADELPDAFRRRVEAVEYMRVVCVILTLDRQVQPVYWLNVADRKIPFGAFIEHTNLLPTADYGGNHVAYMGRYFAPPHYSEEAARLAEGDLDEIAEEWIGHLGRLNPDFDRSWVTSVAPFRTSYGAPVVKVGHGKRRLPFATPVDGLWLATMAQIYPDDRGQSEGVHLALDCVRAMDLR